MTKKTYLKVEKDEVDETVNISLAESLVSAIKSLFSPKKSKEEGEEQK